MPTLPGRRGTGGRFGCTAGAPAAPRERARRRRPPDRRTGGGRALRGRRARVHPPGPEPAARPLLHRRRRLVDRGPRLGQRHHRRRRARDPGRARARRGDRLRRSRLLPLRAGPGGAGEPPLPLESSVLPAARARGGRAVLRAAPAPDRGRPRRRGRPAPGPQRDLGHPRAHPAPARPRGAAGHGQPQRHHRQRPDRSARSSWRRATRWPSAARRSGCGARRCPPARRWWGRRPGCCWQRSRWWLPSCWRTTVRSPCGPAGCTWTR